MIHGPYGVLNKNSPCTEDGTCTKEFPKEFWNETAPNKDGYPRYRSRDTVVIAKAGKYEIDNRWDAHIDVEVCATVKSIKYLFKYVYTGHDCANIKLKLPAKDGAIFAKTLEWDEIKAHLDARYVSAPEAVWRLFQFPLHDESHSIIRLAIRLPNMQSVYFAEGNKLEALYRTTEKDTTLIASFKLNRGNSHARIYLYHDISNHFVFDRENKWKRRQQGRKGIGRMYSISPRDTERYHLRLLLLRTSGACSFEKLETVDNEICQTFLDAARRRGLLCNDTEHERCVAKAVIF
ncbi:unnamed protein product [Rotaria magnacalcarata]|uniref:Uncharacterized protein n=1 Tax=Rotaria magnacalcarata TaxID=392030 RepID=A0A816UL95_9BILA|nr:unnamed protein product [Rotaria magnacalcarata]